MGLNYPVRIIEKRDDLPAWITKAIKSTENETAELNGKEYYVCFTIDDYSFDAEGDPNYNGDLSGYEQFEAWMDAEIEAGRASYHYFG